MSLTAGESVAADLPVPSDGSVSSDTARSVVAPDEANLRAPAVVSISTDNQRVPVSTAETNTMTPPRAIPCSTSQPSSFYRVRVSAISPLPLIGLDEKKRKRKSRTTQAADLTRTPYKRALEATPANRK